MDKKRIEEILRTLTKEQATALYWTCMGKNQVYIAQKIGYMKDGLVGDEMAYVYEKLGIVIDIRRDMTYHSKMTILKKYEIGNILTGLTDGNINNLKNFPMPPAPLYFLTEDEHKSIIGQYTELNSKFKEIDEISSDLKEMQSDYWNRKRELDSKLAQLDSQIKAVERISGKAEELYADLVSFVKFLRPIYKQHQKEKQSSEDEAYLKWWEKSRNNEKKELEEEMEREDDEIEGDENDSENVRYKLTRLDLSDKSTNNPQDVDNDFESDENVETKAEPLIGDVLEPEDYFTPDIETENPENQIPDPDLDSQEQETTTSNFQLRGFGSLRNWVLSIIALLLIFLCIALAFRFAGQVQINP